MNYKNKALSFITKHSGVLAPDGVISQTLLCTFFEITPPDIENTETLTELCTEVNAFNLKKVKAYSAINKEIRARGLVVRQETIKSETSTTIQYRVQAKVETESVIQSYRKQAKVAKSKAKQLRAGYVFAKQVGIYSTTPSYTETVKRRGRPAKYPKIPGIED